MRPSEIIEFFINTFTGKTIGIWEEKELHKIKKNVIKTNKWSCVFLHVNRVYNLPTNKAMIRGRQKNTK